MALATVQEFLDRIDAEYVDQLVGTVPAENPEDPPVVNSARVERALEDASDELAGWLPRVPSAHRPSNETLRVHCIKVALHLLTANRPGGEFVAIRKAYDDVISFYRDLIAAHAAAGGGLPPLEGSACAPEAVFNERTLKGFVR